MQTFLLQVQRELVSNAAHTDHRAVSLQSRYSGFQVTGMIKGFFGVEKFWHVFFGVA